MTANTVLNVGTGGDTIQTFDNTTYKTQAVAIVDSTGANKVAVNTAGAVPVTNTDPFLGNNLNGVGLASTITGLNGASTAAVNVLGTWVGTIAFECSVNGSDWVACNGTPFASTGALVTTSTSNGAWQFDVAGCTSFRVRCSAWTSGTIITYLKTSTGTSMFALDAPLPPGTNLIGKVGIDQTTVGTTNGVSINQIGGGAIVNGGVSGTIGVGGTLAVASASSTNPVFIGGVSLVGANPTAVLNAQRTALATDKVGRLLTVDNHERTMTGVQQTTITSSTAETTIVTAVASTFLDLTHLSITNSSPTATIVTLKDATAGTTRGIWNLAANTGYIALTFDTPLAQAVVNNNWTITCGTSVASIYVVAQYVKNI
jgi:hypothetical protein